jgi:hypothetical protein
MLMPDEPRRGRPQKAPVTHCPSGKAEICADSQCTDAQPFGFKYIEVARVRSEA